MSSFREAAFVEELLKQAAAMTRMRFGPPKAPTLKMTSPPPARPGLPQKTTSLPGYVNPLSPILDRPYVKLAMIEYRGHKFPGYNIPVHSSRAGKKRMVLAKSGGKVRLIHFGQTGYRHNYSEKAKKSYLARSAGITRKDGSSTKNDKLSANYWARRELWPSREPADGTARSSLHKQASPSELLRRARWPTR